MGNSPSASDPVAAREPGIIQSRATTLSDSEDESSCQEIITDLPHGAGGRSRTRGRERYKWRPPQGPERRGYTFNWSTGSVTRPRRAGGRLGHWSRLVDGKPALTSSTTRPGGHCYSAADGYGAAAAGFYGAAPAHRHEPPSHTSRGLTAVMATTQPAVWGLLHRASFSVGAADRLRESRL